MKLNVAPSLAVTAVACVSLFGLAPAASAELVDDASNVIVESTLAAEGVEITDTALLEELAQTVTEAETLGAIDPLVVDEANSIAADPESTTDSFEALVD